MLTSRPVFGALRGEVPVTRKLLTKQQGGLHCESCTVLRIKWYVVDEACGTQWTNAYKIVTGKYESKRPL